MHRDANNALDLADIQGFILRGYRMPMVRHFLLTVGIPAKVIRKLTAANRHSTPRSNRPGDVPRVRAVSPTIASTSALPGPG
jgi:hypothetical protein